MKTDYKVTISCGTKFHSDHVAYQLNKRGMLNKVLTSHPAKYYLNRVPLKKSSVRFLPPVFLLAYGFRWILGGSSKIVHWLNYRLPLVYDQLAARSVKQTSVLLTWAWSGLATIKAVQKRGGIAIVEECGSCSRFQNELLEEEYAALGLSFRQQNPPFIVERQLEEARRADYLLCASQHVAQSFIRYGIAPEKCRVIPYGANVEHFQPKAVAKEGFQILFVGTIGVRKGLVYLFKALQALEGRYPFSCTLIGGVEEPFRPIFEQYSHLFTHIPHVPHQQLADHYSRASVFVFPSLDEGMALVQLEALACGLPVICTTNSGGDSVIEEGREGFVVPIRDHEALAQKISYLLENPAQLATMSALAREKALQFSWERYGEKLAAFIASIKSEQRG